MIKATHSFPAMPEIGHHERYYSSMAHHADETGNAYKHDAAKVGQYITLAMEPGLPWQQKLRYFQHALARHCVTPEVPDEDEWTFYRELAELIKRHAGQEALRLACEEDDRFATRLGLMGESSRESIEADAEPLFAMLLGSCVECPTWYDEGDWKQLKLIRDQWM